jgi:hypothetical protein
MVYTTTDIEKVINQDKWSVKCKLNELLRMDCNMYVNLGINSSQKDKEEVTKASRKIYLAIKSLNRNMGTLFLQAMDKK